MVGVGGAGGGEGGCLPGLDPHYVPSPPLHQTLATKFQAIKVGKEFFMVAYLYQWN